MKRTFDIDGRKYTFYYRDGVKNCEQNSVWGRNEQNILHKDFDEDENIDGWKALEYDVESKPRWKIAKYLPKCIVQAPPNGLAKKYWTIEMWNYAAEQFQIMWE